MSACTARHAELSTDCDNFSTYWGSRLAALRFNHRRMGRKLDRVVASLQLHLRREHPDSQARSMSFPTRWDPYFQPTMTLVEVYRYPTQHFGFHRLQLSGPLAPAATPTPD